MAPSCKAKASPPPGVLIPDKGLEHYATEISKTLKAALDQQAGQECHAGAGSDGGGTGWQQCGKGSMASTPEAQQGTRPSSHRSFMKAAHAQDQGQGVQAQGQAAHGGTQGVEAPAQGQGVQAPAHDGQGGTQVKTELNELDGGYDSSGGYDSTGTWWEKDPEVDYLWWYYRPGKSWGRWMDKSVPLMYK